ncbi:hypothetical protein KDL01_16910 [Actinospica durhamensis]|uniref:PKD domain-containing protein n=1 Tax=Actinospica durhamensis TaxID=1508375 RepID=A0A941IR61_9ACTN|nr:hypothetical protein [Actinospica durhamensis]MBR7834957.1 hypothetical protein [Actinospica durhamensis]
MMVGSLGIALAPALAEAASSTSSTSSVHVTASAAASSSASAFTKKAAEQHKIIFSGNVVRHHTSAAGPNPTLGFTPVGFDTSAYGVELLVAPTGLTTGSATVTVDWGDSSAVTTQTVTSSTTSVTVDHEYSQLGAYTVTITINDGQGDSATQSATAFTAGSEYTAYTPTRILDTRKGIGAPAAAVGAGKTLSLQVAGAGASGDTIPSGITAVVLNVTAVSPTANGVLTVYGDEDAYGDQETLPTTSNVNYKTGQNVPNLVIVPVGANGVVDFHNGGSKGNTQILADVAGYFTADQNTDKYVGISPARILDTRHGTGTGKVAKIPANGSVTLTVAGSDNGTIPAAGVDAISMNLTVVNGTKNGVITAYPDGEATVPTVSNVNYSAGQTIANMSIVKVGEDGKVVLYNNSSGTVDLIADANGYFSSTTTVATASAYLPFDSPERYVDTRATDNSSPIEGAVPTGTPIGVPIAEYSYETAEVFNATVVSPTGNGFLSLYPYNPSSASAVPSTSNLNYLTGQTVPNLAITELGSTLDPKYDGYDFGLYLGGKGTSQVIVDWFGEFQDQ